MIFTKTRLFVLLACSACVTGLGNVTIDDLSPSVILSPLKEWAWSDEGNSENGGTFSFANAEDATVTFTFPIPATAVYWHGFKRSGPALYSICIDCAATADDSSFVAVDAHDPNAQSGDSVTVLFSKTGLSDGFHNLMIKNHFDPRFGAVSQLTVDAFILTSTTVLPEASDSPSMTSMPAGPSQTATQATATPLMSMDSSPTKNSTSGLSTSGIIGTTVAVVLGVLTAALALFLFLRRRKRQYNQVSNPRNFHMNEAEPSSPMLGTLHALPRDDEQSKMVTSPPPTANSWRSYILSPSYSTSTITSPPGTALLDPPAGQFARPSLTNVNTALAQHETYLTAYAASTSEPSTWSGPSRSRSPAPSVGSSISSYPPSSTHSLYSAPSIYSSVRSFGSNASVSDRSTIRTTTMGLSNPFSSPLDTDSDSAVHPHSLIDHERYSGLPHEPASGLHSPEQHGRFELMPYRESLHARVESSDSGRMVRGPRTVAGRSRLEPPATMSVRLSAVLGAMESVMDAEANPPPPPYPGPATSDRLVVADRRRPGHIRKVSSSTTVL